MRYEGHRRRSRLARPALGVLTLLAIVAFAACGEDSDGDAVSAEDLKTGLDLHFRAPYTEQIADGARQAAEDTGTELEIAGPQNFDPPASIQAAQDLAASGAQGIATVAFPPEVWRRPAQELIDSGVELVTLDAGALTLLADDTPTYVGLNEVAWGRTLADVIIDELGPDAEGEVVISLCVPGLPVQEDRAEGFKDRMTEKAPGITVTGPLTTSEEPAASVADWERIIQVNPDALGFFGFCSSDPPSLVKVKEKDPGADYLIGGADLEPDTLRGIEEGTMLVALGANPYLQGYVPIRLIKEQLVDGIAPNKNGWIDPGIEVVTKENVEEVLEREDSKEATVEYYQPKIDEIFDDLDASIQPFAAARE
ncbi:MAG: sugar ABC transporter substrate-binding protein [Actinomycetota bacterium]